MDSTSRALSEYGHSKLIVINASLTPTRLSVRTECSHALHNGHQLIITSQHLSVHLKDNNGSHLPGGRGWELNRQHSEDCWLVQHNSFPLPMHNFITQPEIDPSHRHLSPILRICWSGLSCLPQLKQAASLNKTNYCNAPVSQ